MNLKAVPLFLVLAYDAAAADPLDEILGKMDRSAAEFKGMTADLKQTAHNGVIDDDQTSSGTIRVRRKRPGDTRMLVDFTSPDPKTVQLAGQTLDIYLPRARTVQEYSLGQNSALIEQFLLLGFGTTRKELTDANSVKYVGAETINGKSAIHLMLTPRDKDVLARINRIDIWVSAENGNPLQHKIFQPGGDYQLVQFDNLKINPPDLTDASLKAKLPRDAKVEKH